MEGVMIQVKATVRLRPKAKATMDYSKKVSHKTGVIYLDRSWIGKKVIVMVAPPRRKKKNQ